MSDEAVSHSDLNADEKKLRLAVHTSIKKVTDDFERFSFNTAISSIMEMVNALYVYKENTKPENYNKALIGETIKALVVLLAPFIPHAASEMWEMIGGEGSVTETPWVKYDEKALVVSEVEVVVQINGKIRGKLMISPELNPAQMQEVALNDETVKGLIEGKEVVKVIAVPKKLINIVVK